MDKSILFYKFVNIKDPTMAMRWQKELCTRLNLKGRIIVSPHGINGTLGGHVDDLRRYKSNMNASGQFRGIHYKWSEGADNIFPRLSVKEKPELVAFEAGDEVKIDDETGVIGGGDRIRPEQLHAFLEEHPDAVFFDGRNTYESQVGHFEDAVLPAVRTSRDFISEIESPKYEELKDKTVITYCTGGIRCEILTVLMKNRGFNNVYQLDGGIVTYGKKHPKNSKWQGSCYVFDGRVLDKFDEHAPVIASCITCGNTTEHYSHCVVETCGTQMVICEACEEKQGRIPCATCSS